MAFVEIPVHLNLTSEISTQLWDRGELGLFAPITTYATMYRHVVVNHAATKRVNMLVNRRHWHSVQNRANRFCLAACWANLWLFFYFEHIQSMEQG